MRTLAIALCGFLTAAPAVAQTKPDIPPEYVKKKTRSETIRATLASHGLPNLEGKWLYAGPFDNADKEGFDKAYPPEKGYDPKATFTGKNGATFGWKEFPKFKLGEIVDLAPLFPANARTDAVVYLYLEFDSPKAFTLPLSLGSDDTLSVFTNGTRVLHEDHTRPAAADQARVDMKVKAGKNQLLIKIGQYAGGWEVYVSPETPSVLPATIAKRIDRDFPEPAVVQSQSAAAGNEARFYKIVTLQQPQDCVLEVGGLGFRPDGKLLACTRRGEVWLVHNPGSDTASEVKFTRFAAGLHEALGLHVVDNNTVYVTQRPELTRLVDENGDGLADSFVTLCDKWGVSGDYHEFAFGPAVDKDGNFFVTLNVGFGGGHQAKSAWRGWCVKISPTGAMEPWAYGLRSPNGITFAPDGELFYADNQGEWVATNKLHHLKKGKFYGHQAGLKWVKDSQFAGKVPDKVASGMTYDGQNYPALNKDVPRPDLDPPCVWFPYGRMGQSASEPKWDTTKGKFGPFAGQCFVGDQTRSMVMRVALEKVNGVYQGACFPFRSGLQCGVNRLVFGPDGSLYVGQTNRGWGSVGGKPYGLQRIAFTGEVPLEIHSVALTESGFDLTFTKPLNPKTAEKLDAVSVKSFTYVYYSNYGCPEVDQRAEKVTKTTVSKDGKKVSVTVPGLRQGRVYEIHLTGVSSADGEAVLHPEAYYTLNELVK
ncbi:PQQ-dependent sugar dehydrogenase [Fimbriiglobus ruber]|uniref:DUF7133 domain-containing protein n=1 Tax=Fimbriiglobus ruber TaxID=1908690 RepID=A0A225DSB6_9BACT|nr:PQQ-dependent sugar dehydrogenase [Fimbriiglobus ruber]OWK44350.1 hypothetical protein FRUB_02282 [Fimbriiglobus ruber]